MSTSKHPAYPYRASVDSLHQYKNSLPFREGDIVCVLGEITGMPGHYVVALPDGKVIYGYHNYFTPLNE